MTTERFLFRTLALGILVAIVFTGFRSCVDEYEEAEIVVEAHRDCMDKADMICCNMTPPDFVEYHKARRLLEGERQ